MMGGSGAIGNFKTTSGESSSTSTSLTISPNIGYFFIDKLSVGLAGQFNYVFPKGDSKTIISNNVSPFIRYYFLEKEKQINVFSEARYEIIRMSNIDLKADTFLIKAGAVFFVNSSVGIEVALNYSTQKTNRNFENRAIYLNVGFQIHLEKE
ncbi:hypothetical protein [Flavobacterium sp. ACAM 123]|uniref:hypothetical protein n=1 Tax=Flavobacterium sp. ACAM 123 TaxID=1189620 RepID=UPI00030CA088|nr:hypothetical protein [Flavobacterium sp. ACAM 123]